MLKILDEFIFRFTAKRHLKMAVRERRFVTYKKAKSVFLLFESDYLEKNKEIRAIIHSLQQDGKKVVAWGFLDKKHVTTSLMPDFRVLNHEQTNFVESPKSMFLNELEDLEFDLLIDLTLRPILPLQYLDLYAKASCKVGIRKNDLQLYDFILDVDTLIAEKAEEGEHLDQAFLFNQIIFYLKSIQTSD
jgi:hypothetical protein